MSGPAHGGIAGALVRGESLHTPIDHLERWRSSAVVARRGRAWFGGHEVSPFVDALRRAVDDPIHLTEALVPLVAAGLLSLERPMRPVALESCRPWLSRLAVRAFAALRDSGPVDPEIVGLARPIIERVPGVDDALMLAQVAMPLVAPWWYDELLVILGHPAGGPWLERPVHDRSSSARLVEWLESLSESVILAGRSDR